MKIVYWTSTGRGLSQVGGVVGLLEPASSGATASCCSGGIGPGFFLPLQSVVPAPSLSLVFRHWVGWKKGSFLWS